MSSMQDIWDQELSEDQARSVDPNQLTDNPLTEEQEIYKENILDHYRNPRNFGKTLSCSYSHKEHNPLCGDQLELFVTIQDEKVHEVRFNGRGCAISQASASMLTESIKGKTISELKAITKNEILDMIGIPLGPVRLRCALLSLKTLLKGLQHYQEEQQ